ncbi:unnamed protein product, partial [Porites evermanni]
DAAARGYKQVSILCRHTDVLVLLLAHREQLCQEIWMFAGTSRERRYIPVHRIPLSGISCHYWLADVLAKSEAFVCKLYNPGTQEVEINKERAAEFRKSKKDLDALPPTQDALILHIKRANYQTMVWKKALEPCPSL